MLKIAIINTLATDAQQVSSLLFITSVLACELAKYLLNALVIQVKKV